MFYVYLIQNIVNEFIYVGKSKNVNRRWQEHKTVSRGGKEKYGSRHSYLHSAMSKYGIENFIITTLEYFENENDCFAAEKRYIATLKSDGRSLYNLTEGGDGVSGRVLSDDHKQKISLAMKGKKHSPEFCLHMSLTRRGTQTGERNHQFGKSCSEKNKELLSMLNRGERHHKTTLTEKQVISIRKLFANGGRSYREIGELFGVSKMTISHICKRRTWKHI